jgi:hypothetical protein
MSDRGMFEIDPACDMDTLIAGVQRLGFPSAVVEKGEGFKKPFLIDLRTFERPDAGYGSSVAEDLVLVARFLVEHARDGEVYYSQDLDISDRDTIQQIGLEDVRHYPPSMSRCSPLFLIRS